MDGLHVIHPNQFYAQKKKNAFTAFKFIPNSLNFSRLLEAIINIFERNISKRFEWCLAPTAVVLVRRLGGADITDLVVLRLRHFQTTQIPAKFLIATNAAGDCVRYDKRLSVYVCPPKVKITTQNKEYLQVLDVLDLMDKAPIDTDDPYKLISEYIEKKGLNYHFLLYLADNYYNKKTVLQLAHTAGKSVSF